MKKLLSLLGAVGLVATSTATVVSCGTTPLAVPTEEEFEKNTFEIGDVPVSKINDDKKVTPENMMKDVLAIGLKDSNFQAAYGSFLEGDLGEFDELMEFDNTGILDTRANPKDEGTEEIAINFITPVELSAITFMNFAVDFGKDNTWDVIAHFTFTLTSETEEN
jgi:hypothetical protein